MGEKVNGWLEPPQNEAELLKVAVEQLRVRLPAEWGVGEIQTLAGNNRLDVLLELNSPEGETVRVAIEAKTSLEVRDVPRIREQLESAANQGVADVALVVSKYLRKSVRERLAEANVSYIDATGNVLFKLRQPTVFLSDRGADTDPWRGPGRPRGTLKGEPAAKVVRALVDIPGPWRISDLVKASSASTGSVYRVIEFLQAEALVERGSDGLVSSPDWVALLRRWSKDYQFLQTNATSQWIAPRGLDDLLGRIQQNDVLDYAITGSVAAATWAPYAPARAAMIYCTDVQRAAEAWGLRATDTGANVILAEPAFAVLKDRTLKRSDDLKVAAPSQVAADLMMGPGRAPSEAEHLIDWMKENESSWR